MAFWFEQVAAAQACEHDKNPVVGDPTQIAALAKQLTGTAESLKTQADRLRSVDSEQFWKGDAATAFGALKQTLPPLLDKVVRRYSAVGAALAKYAPDLQQAQESGQRALQAYRDAKGQQQSAQAAVTQFDQLRQQAQQLNRPVDWTGPQPGAQADGANQAAANAIRMMQAAMDTRDAVASTCSRRISDAIDDDLKNDTSLWGKVKKVGQHVVGALEKVAPVLRKVAAVLGVGAGLLGWVPMLGKLLAGNPPATSAVSLGVDATLTTSGRNVQGNLAADALGMGPFGRAARLARFAKPAQGLGRVDAARGYTAFGKEVVRNVGPAYQELTRAMATGDATVRTIGLGAAHGVGGHTGVPADIGPASFALTANKVRGLFSAGGAPAGALAPPAPVSVSSGLPVLTSPVTTGVTSQVVTLPSAA